MSDALSPGELADAELLAGGHGVADGPDGLILDRDDPAKAIRWALEEPGVVDGLAGLEPARVAALILELRDRGAMAKEVDLLDRAVRDTARARRRDQADGAEKPAAPTTTDLLVGLAGDEIAGDLAVLLEAVVEFVRRYVVFRRVEQVWAVALWVAHTYAVQAADTSPRLSIRGPAKRCGKTRLVEVLEFVVFRPLSALLASPSAIYRSLGAGPATVLVDEVDTVFTPKDDRAELRAVINGGQRRGATVPRSEPDPSGGWTVVAFPVFCPMVLSGIGRLPDTVEDRAIIIELARKTRSEKVQRLRFRRASKEGAELSVRLAAWALAAVEQLASAEPALPDELNDRAQDGWEPLLGVAELAGGEWPGRARTAALALAGSGGLDDESTSTRILADVRRVFRVRAETHGLWTAEILEDLNRLEEPGWGGWNDGKGMRPGELAKYLKVYGVHSRDLWRANGPDGKEATRKGYYASDLVEPWGRYLGPEDTTPQKSAGTPPEKALGGEVPYPTTISASQQTLGGQPDLAAPNSPDPLSRKGPSGLAPFQGGCGQKNASLPPNGHLEVDLTALEDTCAACPQPVAEVDPDTGDGYCTTCWSERAR